MLAEFYTCFLWFLDARASLSASDDPDKLQNDAFLASGSSAGKSSRRGLVSSDDTAHAPTDVTADSTNREQRPSEDNARVQTAASLTSNDAADDDTVVAIDIETEEVHDIEQQSNTARNASKDLVDLLPKFVPPPNFTFPKRTFGKENPPRQKSCGHNWFVKYPWLSYVVDKDAVICHPCSTARAQGLTLFEKRKKNNFIEGYNNWNDGFRRLDKHQESAAHSESVLALQRHRCSAVNELLDEGVKKSKCDNNALLCHMIDALRLLARQNIAVRGATIKLDAEPSLEPQHSEPNSNIWQVLMLMSKYSGDLGRLLKRKTNFSTPQVQNELLLLMSKSVQRQLANEINQASSYSVMVDETTDVTNKTQAVFCFRFVQNLVPHEHFLGLYEISDTSAHTLFTTLKDVLLQLNIPLQKCRGQCYDGAAAMSGKRAGLKTKLQEENPKAVYIHCYAHTLQLAVQDSCRSVKLFSDALDLASEVVKLIKCSPKREAEFRSLKALSTSESSINIRTLCPTRWTVRAACFESIIKNYSTLLELFEECLAGKLEAEVKSRIIGVMAQMKSFNSYFGLQLSFKLFQHTDNLSKALQHADLSAGDGVELADAVVKLLDDMRTADTFNTFFSSVKQLGHDLGLNEPTVPQKRKAPTGFDEISGNSYHPDSAVDHCRMVYFNAVDTIRNGIKSRFNQEDLAVYTTLKLLLVKSLNRQSVDGHLKKVADVYGEDFDLQSLAAQLQLLPNIYDKQDSFTIASFSSWLKQSKNRPLLSEVEKLVSLLLTLPATNAVSERSFSALRRVKTYLRSTMKQSRLNSIMVLHVHKDKTDGIDPQFIIRDYVSGHRGRAAKIAYTE